MTPAPPEPVAQLPQKAGLFDRLAVLLFLLLAVVLAYASSGWVTFPLIALCFVITIRSALAPGRPVLRRPDTASWCLLVAFGLIAVAFTLSARQPGDLAYIFNFLMFALLHPLQVMLGRFASPRNVMRFSLAAFAACVLAVAIAADQVLVAGMPRASAFSDPIWSAQAVLAVGFLGVAGLYKAPGWWKLPVLLCPILASGVAVMSGSRGPLLAVPVLAMLFVLLNVRRPWLVLGAVALLVALATAGTALLWPAGFERLSSLATIAGDFASTGRITEQSGHERQLMYQTALPAFRDSPLFGHGWVHMLEAIAPYLPNGLASFKQVHLHLHSDLLDFAVSGGLLGLIAYALVLLGPVLGCLQSPRDGSFRFRLTAISLLSAGYFLFGLSYLLLGYEFHTTLYVCLVAVVLAYCRDRDPAAPPARPD